MRLPRGNSLCRQPERPLYAAVGQWDLDWQYHARECPNRVYRRFWRQSSCKAGYTIASAQRIQQMLPFYKAWAHMPDTSDTTCNCPLPFLSFRCCSALDHTLQGATQLNAVRPHLANLSLERLKRLLAVIAGIPSRRYQLPFIIESTRDTGIDVITGAQPAFILFSTFLDPRPVSGAHDVQTSINSL
jgi:hypothetical protein